MRESLRRRGLVLYSVFCILLGCQDDVPHIEFWTMQLSGFRPYIERVIADFEKSRPGTTVVWVDVPFTAMGQKLMTAYVAGRPPDVVNLNVDLASSLAHLGALVDVRDHSAGYLPSVWESLRVGEGVYAFPWYLSTEVTIYNSKLLAEPPRRFEDLPGRVIGKYAMCPKIGSDTDLLKFFMMNGARVLQDGKMDFSDPVCRETLLFWKKLLEAGQIPPEALTESHRVAIDLYIRGQAAILLSGPQFLKIVKQNNPEVYAATKVAPCILGRAGLTNIAVMNVAVTTASPRREDAIAFAAFLTHGLNQLALCREAAILPSVESALEDPFFSREETLEDQARAIAARQLRTSKVLVRGLKRQAEIQKILQQATQEVCFNGADPDAVLRRAEETINRLIR